LRKHYRKGLRHGAVPGGLIAAAEGAAIHKKQTYINTSQLGST